MKNNFSTKIWRDEAKKFELIEERVKIPDETLKNVDCVELRDREDFEEVPCEGGCYWIWANEPVYHRLHKNIIPQKVDKGEVIYNGIAKDDVNKRVQHHLLGEINAGWSGISLDIFVGSVRSHKKKVFSKVKKTKVPYIEINGVLEPIRDKKLISYLSLSEDEKNYINSNSKATTFYFRNGINIFEKKHKEYKFKVYFITGVKWLYLEYVEKKWREKYGLPKLCSYSAGR